MKKTALLFVTLFVFAVPAFGAVANCVTPSVDGKREKIINSFRSALSKSGGMAENHGADSASGSRGETKISINLFPINKDNNIPFDISAQGSFFAGKWLVQDVMTNMPDIDAECRMQ